MSVIEASSAGVKDMADGSLRITFEFEPRHAADAFALFGPRGRGVAIAALVDGHAAITSESASEVKEKQQKEREHLGDLCWRAVQWCNDPEFQKWINVRADFKAPPSAEQAKQIICSWCQVESRKELDESPEVAERFNKFVRGPYQKHLQARGLV